MPIAADEFARRSGSRIEFRDEPLCARWILTGLCAADAHEVRCGLRCSVRVARPASDRRLFEEVFLAGSDAAPLSAVEAHLLGPMRSAASRFVSPCSAPELMGGGRNAELIDELRRAATPVAFACGLELLPPFEIEMTSRTLTDENVRRMTREREVSRLAGQTEHLRRAGDLYRQFAALKEEFPGVSTGRLIERFAPADRGSVLDSLLLAGSGPGAAATLWAVAGPYLVRMTLSDDESPPQLIALPKSLGPLRSVRMTERNGIPSLLAGARSGVFLIDPERADAPVSYVDPDLSSDLGFNSAVILSGAGALLAGHTEGGLVTWELDKPDRPIATRRGPNRPEMKTGPRHLVSLDRNSAAYAIGCEVAFVGAHGEGTLPAASPSAIVAILPVGDRSIVAHEDGTVFATDRATHERLETRVFPGKYTAAASMPLLGEARLLLARDEGSAECVSLDDSLVTRFAAGAHRGFRTLSATCDWVAGLTADRQRLVLWRTWDPGRPVREIHLAAMTRHRIADIVFGG